MNTSKLSGMVVHMIVRPDSEDTIWDLALIDKEKDEICEIKEYDGRLDDKSGLPLGKDKQEKITIQFDNVTKNEPIKVIFKTQEIV